MRRTKDDAEQTRAAILDAAEELFCARGIDGATLESISRAAGVTRGAFYWHFRDKTDLLQALSTRSELPQRAMLQHAAKTAHSDPMGLLEQAGQDALMIFEADLSTQRMFWIMSGCSRDTATADWLTKDKSTVFALLNRIIQQAQNRGQIRPDFTAKEAALLLMTTLDGLLYEWLRSDRAFPLAKTGGKLLQAQIAMLRAAHQPMPPSGCPPNDISHRRASAPSVQTAE
ncbi:MAG: TetR family transcriptional regulator [Paracoccus sp. (in: a-proteobacteria)]|uniref:TetR family transcriptional regulator n=1 Tax=Paracoccus sp. TaxID=267 RepID=UPI0026DF0DC3|nr:TetR family transcriptional regulator [Paracoccus sp. (in: a-proteobacteria)]MDO5630628.1 TetR family transcriptional regulator [Paracoccus sp. (in: a-proteobacteria)]